MHDFFEKAPDPFADLLGPPGAPAGGEPLRADLLRRTAGVLCRRRRLRRLALALGMALCYAAGLLTMHWATRPAAVPPPGQLVDKHEGLTGPPAGPEDPAAVARAWEEVKRRRAELYREAGDLYLTARDDPEGALRCYGDSLDAGRGQDLSVSPSDSWLLMAIKAARQKEKDDAKKSS